MTRSHAITLNALGLYAVAACPDNPVEYELLKRGR
jgi:hypothetical protein